MIGNRPHFPVSASKLKDIRLLFSRTGATQRNTNWIYLNRIWYEPKSREKLYSLIEEFLDYSLAGIQNPVLLVPEGLSSSFGIVPFISVYADKRKYHLLFWKEFGDILTIAPFIFPQPEKLDLPENFNLVVIQDVVGNGSLLYKVSKYLLKHDQGWQIRSLLAVICLDRYKSELEKLLGQISVDQKNKVDFDYCISDLGIKG